MADENDTGSKTPEKDENPRFDEAYHRARARSLYDASPFALAGALAGEDRKTHTVDQVKDAVRRFNKREVEVDNEGDG